MNILIADDDPLVGELLGAAFRKQGWRSTFARDSMQSMMFAVRDPQPDVILLDLSMPGGAGMDVLKRLKASTKTADIPVLIVTGSTDAALRERAAELGADDYINKPVDPDTVIARVRELVR